MEEPTVKDSTTADTTVRASCAQKLTQPMRLHGTIVMHRDDAGIDKVDAVRCSIVASAQQGAAACEEGPGT